MNPTNHLFRRIYFTASVFILSLTAIASAQQGYVRQIKGNWFYDPAKDTIPWNPRENKHGPDYDIPDDEWKVEADKRIDKYRKRNLTITIVDSAGHPVKNVPVKIELVRHHFLWGAVATPTFEDGPEGNNKRQYLLKYFNAAGYGMGFKPRQSPGEGGDGRPNRFQEAMAQELPWLLKHDFYVRGHNLVWEGARFLHSSQQRVLRDESLSDAEKGKKIYSMAANNFHYAIKRWDVDCWDVINEPRANHVINDLLPDKNTFVEWFRLSGELRKQYGRPDMKLYYNEYQIISHAFNRYEQYRDNYMGHIQDLIDAGAPIEGIGFQYRMKKYLPPETQWERLKEFEKFGLPLQVTEFEAMGDKKKAEKNIPTFSDAERKRITAECMTLFFSHPLADGFWHWSWTDRSPSIQQRNKRYWPYALMSWEGEPRAEMEQWMKMMERDFDTDVTRKTGTDGTARVRGFKGIYKITVGEGKNAKTAVVKLEEDTHEELSL